MPEPKFKPNTVITQKVVSNTFKRKPRFDTIETTQQAINMAVAENRVVRFETTKSNPQIKKEIDNLKGCLLRKPAKDSSEVAIIPPGIEDFCFEDQVDTGIIIPNANWYKN